MDKFDSQIIGVVRGEMGAEDNERGILMYHIEPQTGKVSPLDYEVFRAQALIRGTKSKAANGPAYDYFRRIIELHDPALLDLVMKGRSQMNVVINSPGGRGIVADFFNGGIRHVRRNGGVVNTYGLNEVSSAATHIWREGDNRYMLDDTHSVWHTGELPDGTRPDEACHREELIRYFLDNAGVGELRNRVVKTLRESVRGEVELCGEDLVNLGLAHKGFNSFDSMKQHILQETELILDESGLLINRQPTA